MAVNYRDLVYYSMFKFFDLIRSNILSFLRKQESIAANTANPGSVRFLLSQE